MSDTRRLRKVIQLAKATGSDAEIRRERRPDIPSDRLRGLLDDHQKAKSAVQSLPKTASRDQRYAATSSLYGAEVAAARELGLSELEFREGADTGVWRKGPAKPLQMPQPNGRPRWAPGGGGEVPFPRVGYGQLPNDT
jgi:hypothetical protein